MPRCSSCSAPLPAKSIICSYCNTRNDIDLSVPVKKVEISFASDRICPDCRINLRSVDVGKNGSFLVEKCFECYGLFFDNQELERMLEERMKNSYWIDYYKVHSLLQNPRHHDAVVYRRCPVCSELMQRKNYKKHSGVIMDVCEADGVWLDAGELKQLLEWIELGGHNKNRTRKEITDKTILSQKKEEKRAHLNHKSQEGDNHRPSQKRALGRDPYSSILSDFFSL